MAVTGGNQYSIAAYIRTEKLIETLGYLKENCRSAAMTQSRISWQITAQLEISSLEDRGRAGKKEACIEEAV